MKIELTFEYGNEVIEVPDAYPVPRPIFSPGNAAYVEICDKNGDTHIFNWNKINKIRSFLSETDAAKEAAKQQELPGIKE